MKKEVLTHPAAELRLHLTNVVGAGASQLLLSLLPAIERHTAVHVTELHLPDRGPLAAYQSAPHSGLCVRYRRSLPNAISRVLECLVFSRKLSGDVPLLVLGDLPLRCRAPQTVFVQTSLLLTPSTFQWSFGSVKYVLSRLIFRANAKFVRQFVVQTNVMRDRLAQSYPAIADKIKVIAQPVPDWLFNCKPVAPKKVAAQLNLIYPAAGYPHKNHRLLQTISSEQANRCPVGRLQLTLPPQNNPAAHIPWIQCTGFLTSAEMVRAYREADALIFLSKEESYGFPLIEAMYMGLPVVCPDLPYAHALCVDGAIYFDPDSAASLLMAIRTLQSRLTSGWRPDWSTQLAKIPQSWDAVAASMVAAACEKQ